MSDFEATLVFFILLVLESWVTTTLVFVWRLSLSLFQISSFSLISSKMTRIGSTPFTLGPSLHLENKTDSNQ